MSDYDQKEVSTKLNTKNLEFSAKKPISELGRM